jgi:hypothetical protein
MNKQHQDGRSQPTDSRSPQTHSKDCDHRSAGLESEAAAIADLKGKIEAYLLDAIEVLTGEGDNYAMTADFKIGGKTEPVESHFIAVRLNENCPRVVRAAVSQLLAIMAQQRSSTSQAQEDNS